MEGGGARRSEVEEQEHLEAHGEAEGEACGADAADHQGGVPAQPGEVVSLGGIG